MPKVLIAVATCHKFRYRADEQRRSWVPKVKDADVKFFLGHGTAEHPMEVVLDTPDDYLSLPAKIRSICRWAIERDYDYVFKVDDDSYVHPVRILTESEFQVHDYIGRWNANGWASGGPGYWLSSKAMKLVVEAPESEDWAEDRITGRIMAANNIPCTVDFRYHIYMTPKLMYDYPPKSLITVCPGEGEMPMLELEAICNE